MFLKMMRGGKVKDSYRKADSDVARASEEEVYFLPTTLNEWSPGDFSEDKDISMVDSLLIKMRRTNKKDLNLNQLKRGCSPCLNEAKKMQQKLSNREISQIKIQEIKKIVSSLFKKN